MQLIWRLTNIGSFDGIGELRKVFERAAQRRRQGRRTLCLIRSPPV